MNFPIDIVYIFYSVFKPVRCIYALNISFFEAKHQIYPDPQYSRFPRQKCYRTCLETCIMRYNNYSYRQIINKALSNLTRQSIKALVASSKINKDGFLNKALAILSLALPPR